MRRGLRLMAVALTAAAGLGAAGLRQPEKQPGPTGASGQPADDRAALRARLERRLEEAKRVEDRIQAAIKRLDGGESPATVQNDVEGAGRTGRGPGRFSNRGPGDHGSSDHGPGEKGGPEGRGPRMDQAEILAAVQKFNPAMADRLRSVAKDNPAVGGRIIARLEPQVREIEGEKDPETRELRIAELNNGFETVGAMRQLAEQIRGGQPTTELEAKLRSLIGDHFDLQLKLREREIVKLEDKVKQLHAELDERRPNRESFITERVEQIKRGAAHMGNKSEPHPAPDREHGGAGAAASTGGH